MLIRRHSWYDGQRLLLLSQWRQGNTFFCQMILILTIKVLNIFVKKHADQSMEKVLDPLGYRLISILNRNECPS